MAIPSDDIREESFALRAELKEWEREFATLHDGRKPGREDIKQHPEIANKYKFYDKQRLGLSRGFPDKLKHPCTSSRKRTSTSVDGSNGRIHSTPIKRIKHTHDIHPATIDPYERPTSILLTPSKARTFIGPTPQKDGRVLGLFDGLSSGSVNKKSSTRHTLLPVTGNAQVTPSKHASAPSSLIKQHMSQASRTPSARRIVLNEDTPSNRERSTTRNKMLDDTPAFLRRDSQRAFIPHNSDDGDAEEGNKPWSPIINRRPAPIRGLSALVKGLRAMQDEALDDDLDMLRDMENGSTFESFAGKLHSQAKKSNPDVLVGDSQMPEMPLGPDRNIDSEDASEDARDKTRSGAPLKVWKKRGQKRTTRRVNMKPNQAVWKPEPKWKGHVDESDVEEQDGDTKEISGVKNVQDSQIVESNRPGGESALPNAADTAFEDSCTEATEGEGDHDEDDIVTKMKAYTKAKAAFEKDKKDGLVHKVKKKISATAHANFKALKIRNKNSKAKGGGRFGKRR